jgi:glycosyltransferase involved in cell wall biosynthesis
MGDGVTVVVPTLNRGEVLVATVRDLLEQIHRPLEILVIDQSDEQDSELLKLEQVHPGVVTYRHVAFRGLPVARNYGWMNARYDAVVYVDDDVEVPDDFVRAHLEGLRQDSVGMVGGRIVEAWDVSNGRAGPGHTGKFNSISAVANRCFDVSGFFDIDHVPGGNFSGWRDVLRGAGGFDERLGVGAALLEETELCLRVREAGNRVVFEGAASLMHLRAGEGGCRDSDVPRYVHSLARNRSVVIRRHVCPVYWPIALGRSLLYGLSYTVAYSRPTVFGSCMHGMIEGWRLGGLAPLCTGGWETDR